MEDMTKAADGECKSSHSIRRKTPMADPLFCFFQPKPTLLVMDKNTSALKIQLIN